jgi:hypothetical protein
MIGTIGSFFAEDEATGCVLGRDGADGAPVNEGPSAGAPVSPDTEPLRCATGSGIVALKAATGAAAPASVRLP